jgi:hypothetical protein
MKMAAQDTDDLPYRLLINFIQSRVLHRVFKGAAEKLRESGEVPLGQKPS